MLFLKKKGAGDTCSPVLISEQALCLLHLDLFLILPEAQLEKEGGSTKAAASFVHVGIFLVVGAPVVLGGARRGRPSFRICQVNPGKPGVRDHSLLQAAPDR